MTTAPRARSEPAALRRPRGRTGTVLDRRLGRHGEHGGWSTRWRPSPTRQRRSSVASYRSPLDDARVAIETLVEFGELVKRAGRPAG